MIIPNFQVRSLNMAVVTEKLTLKSLASRIEQYHNQRDTSKSQFRYPEDFRKDVCKLHGQGATVKDLSKNLGVSVSTVYKWIKRGKPKYLKTNKSKTNPTLQKKGFKEVKLTESQNIVTNKKMEARIELSTGLSIFIPIQALNYSFLTSLQG